MYFKPYIDETGFNYPSYSDIRDKLIEEYRNIYGQDFYLENDSMDYQYICALSNKIHDSHLAAELVYNSRSPSTAVGAGLDSIVKINGLDRKGEKYSTVVCIMSGTPNETITNGKGLDKSDIVWDIPEFTFNSEGTAIATAICTIPGSISCNPGDMIQIFNPQPGWTSIKNEVSAKLGRLEESDTILRQRQSESVSLPSKTLLDGTYAAIYNIDDVRRCRVYENDTNEIDSLGLPPHSITCVVEDGDDKEIANAIMAHKAPGCYTNGSVSNIVLDKKGEENTIRFFRPEYVDVDVEINIKIITSLSDDMKNQIINNLVTYSNSVKIGTNVNYSLLWGITLKPMLNSGISNITPSFSITALTIAKHGDVLGTSDVLIGYKQCPRISKNNVSIVEV